MVVLHIPSPYGLLNFKIFQPLKAICICGLMGLVAVQCSGRNKENVSRRTLNNRLGSLLLK